MLSSCQTSLTVPSTTLSLHHPTPLECAGALGGTEPVPQSIPAPRVWDPGGKVGVLCPIPHCRACPEPWKDGGSLLSALCHLIIPNCRYSPSPPLDDIPPMYLNLFHLRVKEDLVILPPDMFLSRGGDLWWAVTSSAEKSEKRAGKVLSLPR